MSTILIEHALLINEGVSQKASVLIENEQIARILPDNETCDADEKIDATGLWLLPGVIDDHVHFRDPGLTHKADMFTESRAAAAGGVTSYLEMPNTNPQTTTLQDWANKQQDAAQKSLVNYAFFVGATQENTDILPKLADYPEIPGVKLFMGSSTGNMLVDQQDSLLKVFENTPKDMIIMTHCEDTPTINENAQKLKALYGDDPDVIHHPEIRSTEACYKSTSLAVQLAKQTGARLHVAHLTTAKELGLFQAEPYSAKKRITAEACVAHLFFTDADYQTLGTRIKCNPAVKTADDRKALRQALTDGRIDVVGTDHAPHLLSDKQGGCLKAASGMPMVQFSLVTMLELAKDGILSKEQVVNLLCHRPAQLFQIQQRGFVREGYQADLVLVDPTATWTLQNADILSKCKWSPVEGQTYHNKVVATFCNGKKVFFNQQIVEGSIGQPLHFR
ncbi:MAG: dihydroorotase [Bacteroidales bacterium]|nr:dihydroorotase [Bacteroidales bacterium]